MPPIMYNIVSFCKLCRKRMVQPKGQTTWYCSTCEQIISKSRKKEEDKRVEEEKKKAIKEKPKKVKTHGKTKSKNTKSKKKSVRKKTPRKRK